MAGFTYTQLKQAIQDYTDNQEATFVANIDNFIKAAEERVLSMAPLEVFRKNATAVLNKDDPYLQKPNDWLFTYSISIKWDSQVKFLLNKDQNFVRDFWPELTDTAEPKYYTDFDVDTFMVVPTADQNYEAQISYFYRPTSLVDAPSGTTWLGTNAGPTLLYGSLVEAYTFIKGEPDMIGQYDQQFQKSLQMLNAFAQAAEGLDFYRRTGA